MGIYTRLVVKVEVGFGHGMASFSFDEMAWKRAFEEPEVAPGHYRHEAVLVVPAVVEQSNPV
jgi:hypothetical protein